MPSTTTTTLPDRDCIPPPVAVPSTSARQGNNRGLTSTSNWCNARVVSTHAPSPRNLCEALELQGRANASTEAHALLRWLAMGLASALRHLKGLADRQRASRGKKRGTHLEYTSSEHDHQPGAPEAGKGQQGESKRTLRPRRTSGLYADKHLTILEAYGKGRKARWPPFQGLEIRGRLVTQTRRVKPSIGLLAG